MSSPSSSLCLICLKPDAEVCKRCRSAHYCSRACQFVDWPVHKAFCKLIAEEDPFTPRWRAFFFEPGKPKPSLVRVHTTTNPIEGTATTAQANIDTWIRLIGRPILGMPRVKTCKLEYDVITTNLRTGHKLKNTLVMFYRSDGGLYGSNGKVYTNTSADGNQQSAVCTPLVMTASEVYGHLEYACVGPFVICAFGADDGMPRHVTTEDFRHVIDFIGFYERGHSEDKAEHSHITFTRLRGDERVDVLCENSVFLPMPDFPLTAPENLLRGLELQCAQNMVANMTEALSVVGVLPHSPMRMFVWYGSVSPLSNRLGIPVRLAHNTRGADRKSANYHATALMMQLDVDVDDADWGTVPSEWSGDVGNVTLFHHNGLTADSYGTCDLIAMCAFALAEVQPRVRHAKGQGTREAKEEVMKYVSHENFMRYHARWSLIYQPLAEQALQNCMNEKKKREKPEMLRQ